MEIIHLVLGKANPNRMNGVNKVVFQLASNQARFGKVVSIWGIAENLLNDYPERNFNTQLFQAQKNLFNLDENLKKAIKNLSDRDVVIHIHGGWIPTFSSIAKLFKKYKIRYVFTPHGAYNVVAMQRSKWKKKLYFQLYEKQMLRGAEVVHCIGQSEVNGLKKLSPSSNYFLMPYGFEVEKVGLAKQPIQNEEFIIGFLGRLDIYTKGLDLLIQAFKNFSAKVPNTKLWIIGDSKERLNLEKMIKQCGIEDHVVLWGKKFGEEKNQLLQKMHVFAHPSRNEGLPSAVLEASVLGVPSIVSQATNVGQMIEAYDCGIEVSDEDSMELSQAMTSMYHVWQSTSFARMKTNANHMVKEVFDWNTIVDNYDQMYVA